MYSRLAEAVEDGHGRLAEAAEDGRKKQRTGDGKQQEVEERWSKEQETDSSM